MKSPLSKAILDTNLLLLWLVARTDISLLYSFKRVQAFTYEDTELLRDTLKPYPEFVSTPHVLSETSNFINQAPAWRRDALVDELKTYIQTSRRDLPAGGSTYRTGGIQLARAN